MAEWFKGILGAPSRRLSIRLIYMYRNMKLKPTEINSYCRVLGGKAKGDLVGRGLDRTQGKRS